MTATQQTRQTITGSVEITPRPPRLLPTHLAIPTIILTAATAISAGLGDWTLAAWTFGYTALVVASAIATRGAYLAGWSDATRDMDHVLALVERSQDLLEHSQDQVGRLLADEEADR